MASRAGQRLLSAFERVGVDPSDTDQIRLQRQLVVAIASMVGVAAVFWGLAYIALDEPLAALIPLGYAAVTARVDGRGSASANEDPRTT